jgi:hypothetical protein
LPNISPYYNFFFSPLPICPLVSFVNLPLRRLGLLVALLAYGVAAGGHVALTQALAWTTMIWSEHQGGLSWQDAVIVTLEGRRPCRLCRGLAAAQTTQPADTVYCSKSRDKLKCPPLPRTLIGAVPHPVPERPPIPRDSMPPATRTDRPPVPPPRAA